MGLIASWVIFVKEREIVVIVLHKLLQILDDERILPNLSLKYDTKSMGDSTRKVKTDT